MAKTVANIGGNISVQTAAVGATWVAFPAGRCKRLAICNDTTTAIEFRQGATPGVPITVEDKTQFVIEGLTTANQIEVRRKDQAATQVAVKARWGSW
jgi:hypothetical protein